jgi:hypothetical protein
MNVPGNMDKECDDMEVLKFFNDPKCLESIKNSEKKMIEINLIFGTSLFEVTLQNWLWFVLFVMHITEVKEIAFDTTIWEDDFWKPYYPVHVVHSNNGKLALDKFNTDLSAFALMCLAPDLPFEIRCTPSLGLGVFAKLPESGIQGGRSKFVVLDRLYDSLFGFSFSLPHSVSYNLETSDLLQDIVSIQAVKKHTNNHIYHYWICGPIAFVNHACDASHCLVSLDSRVYKVGGFVRDEFDHIKRVMKTVYKCLHWDKVENCDYKLKKIVEWEYDQEFVVRYSFKGYFTGMTCLCLHCSSSDKRKATVITGVVADVGFFSSQKNDKAVAATLKRIYGDMRESKWVPMKEVNVCHVESLLSYMELNGDTALLQEWLEALTGAIQFDISDAAEGLRNLKHISASSSSTSSSSSSSSSSTSTFISASALMTSSSSSSKLSALATASSSSSTAKTSRSKSCLPATLVRGPRKLAYASKSVLPHQPDNDAVVEISSGNLELAIVPAQVKHVARKRALESMQSTSDQTVPNVEEDQVPWYNKKHRKLEVEYHSNGIKKYSPSIAGFGSWT